MNHSDWFLTADERGNPAATLDHGAASWSTGNTVTPLIDGRRYFSRLYEVLTQTKPGDLVLFTDWRGDPDEMLAGPGTAVATVLTDLAARGVRVKGLMWRSHPDQTRFSQQENRDLASSINAAGGEVLLDERVRRAGSHHQKLFVVVHPQSPADDVAFVGGIDLCHGRNDDGVHLGDPQTIRLDPRYGSTPAWHDIQLEVHGPAVADLAQTFGERWNDPLGLSYGWSIVRRLKSRGTSRPAEFLPPITAGVAPRGAHAVQVLRTYPAKRPPYPFAVKGERSIARAYAKAFARARRLIYIEDQYLWSADVARVLGAALRREPRLRVVVVVPRYPDEDGPVSGPPNRVGQLIALRHLRAAGGSRLAVYDLEGAEAPIYVHAKVCIVDDVWMTVGSDNLNRRSWTHDSELSCAVLDDTLDRREPHDPAGIGDGARALARETRLTLWAEHLERTDLPVGFDDGFDLLRTSADALDRWERGGRVGPRPAGRLRHHHQRPVAAVQRPLARLLYGLLYDPDGRPLRMRLRRSF